MQKIETKRTATTCFSLLLALAAANTAYAGTIIPHNQVQPLPANASAAERHWQPQLKVYQGCHPFPAVDQWGNWSGGLNDSGALDGGCNSSVGQVYVRGKWYSSTKCAVMYAWYFPKDSSLAGQGHRHDWESVVVWLKDGGCSSATAAGINQVHAVSYSQHGGFYKEYSPSSWHFTGSHIKALYKKVQYFGYGNHSMNSTTDGGGYQPLVEWTYMDPDARYALNHANFGDAHCPINDNNFESSMAKARPSGF